jgi:glycyl-tRNA synthetase beta chain
VTDRDDFLVEIGTEELPPKALLLLSTVFRRELEKGLDAHGLAHGGAEAFATPRRLAVKISKLAKTQDDQLVERRGPALAGAFDSEGSPTKAALGFAASCGVEVAALGRLQTDKGEWLSFSAKNEGRPTIALLPAVVDQALAALPIPKPMRWGSGTEEFVRPVHWVVMLFGEQTVDSTILGIKSGSATRGHRFLAQNAIELNSPADYPEVLEKTGFVIAGFERRRKLITRLSQETATHNGGRAVIDEELLDEVTALVEWPVPICGSFDRHFLDLPREILVASMQNHQKYFPVESADGKLTNKFITVCNIESRDPDAVRHGNERVIRPRLSDASFFWDQDRKARLEQRIDRIDGIVFEKRLGSIKDKTNRIVDLARALASDFGADGELAARAALLSRCDLVTNMVGEFPELQGIMGGYYATHDGEPEEVANALGEFYLPRFAGDSIPATAVGRCVAYADKLDSLVGIFAVGSAPTGDKDPYGLRRAALGCIRIALESGSTVGFAKVFKFILDRLRGYYAEQKIAGSVVEAVLAVDPDQPADIQLRIAAVAAFRRLPEAAALAAANKRIANILRKSGVEGSAAVDEALLQDPAERSLAESIDGIAEAADGFAQAADFEAYLKALAELHDPINVFFDEVMVMCDDEKVRDNRIALLNRIRKLFTRVADIARLND